MQQNRTIRKSLKTKREVIWLDVLQQELTARLAEARMSSISLLEFLTQCLGYAQVKYSTTIFIE